MHVFSVQRWQYITCHLSQCTASLWSTASTSWPTIATHVSAKTKCIPYCLVLHMDAFDLYHFHFQLCSRALVVMWNACTGASETQCWHLWLNLCKRLPVFIILFCWTYNFVLIFVLKLSFSFVFCILTPILALCALFIFFTLNLFDNLFHPSICLSPLGIPKTRSPNSTILSLKRLLVSMSLPAAPMTLGILMMRRMRISSRSQHLHLCHQARRPHLPRKRYVTRNLMTEHWHSCPELKVSILTLSLSAAAAKSGWWCRHWGIPQSGSSTDRSSKPSRCSGGRYRVPVCQRQDC